MYDSMQELYVCETKQDFTENLNFEPYKYENSTDSDSNKEVDDERNKYNALHSMLDEIEQEMQSASVEIMEAKPLENKAKFEYNRKIDEKLISKQISEYALEISENGERIKYLTSDFVPIIYTDGFKSLEEQENLYVSKTVHGTLLKSTSSSIANFVISDQVSFETEGFVDASVNDQTKLFVMFQGGLFSKLDKYSSKKFLNEFPVKNKIIRRSNSLPNLENGESNGFFIKQKEILFNLKKPAPSNFADKNIQVDIDFIDSSTQTLPFSMTVIDDKTERNSEQITSDYSKQSSMHAVYSNFTKNNDDLQLNKNNPNIENVLARSNSFNSDENTEAQTTTDFNGSFYEYEILTPTKKTDRDDNSSISYKPATHKYLSDKYIYGNDRICITNESKKWIELTEDKLNCLIQQTDAILKSLFIEDFVSSESNKYSIAKKNETIRNKPVNNQAIYNNENTGMREVLKKSKKEELDLQKKQIINAFNMERERELNLCVTSKSNNSMKDKQLNLYESRIASPTSQIGSSNSKRQTILPTPDSEQRNISIRQNMSNQSMCLTDNYFDKNLSASMASNRPYFKCSTNLDGNYTLVYTSKLILAQLQEYLKNIFNILRQNNPIYCQNVTCERVFGCRLKRIYIIFKKTHATRTLKNRDSVKIQTIT